MKIEKQIIVILFIFLLAMGSCKKKKDEHDNSFGNINEISVIITDALWSGEVGDSIRKKLAAPVDGLLNEEPLFTINQYPDKIFDGALTKGRNIIVVEKGKPNNFTFKQNKFCAPQNIFTLSGENTEELLMIIQMHSEEIIKTIKDTETIEIQSRNEKAGLLNENTISNLFGVYIKVPKAYSPAIEDKNFLWLKKDIPSGNCNILIYSVAYDVIEQNKNILNNIIKMRDSIGKLYIHSQEENAYMVTEEAYSPYFFTTSLKHKKVFETRGNWEMKNDFMNGPFLNYAIKDEKNRKYIVIEGFIYSPSSPKRDLVVELESIIKSVTFP